MSDRLEPNVLYHAMLLPQLGVLVVVAEGKFFKGTPKWVRPGSKR
jgi:hypothetical protein